MNKYTIGLIGLGAIALSGLALTYNSFIGNNDSGQRKFLQTYMGDESIKFVPGPFGKWAGDTTTYNDVLTLDNTGADGKCEYERSDGFKVQYGDGGMGVICMQAQFPLPSDEATMIGLHKRFRSEEGIRTKLNAATLRSLFTNTAKLYTSTEAYSTKSSELQNDIKFQVLNGGYQTITEEREIETGVDENGAVVKQKKSFAIIKVENGSALTVSNPFSEWGMEGTIQIQITGFDFEQKTIDQIALRRDATNRAETAQDNAKAAYWETKQAEADGEKARVTEEFYQKKLAEVEIQQAEKIKRLALIDAERQQESATLLEQAAIARTAQARQDLAAAQFEADKIVKLAEANAKEIDLMQQAGELFKSIEADVQKNKDMAEAIAQMKVPTTMIVGSGGANDGSSEMQQLLQLQVLDKLKVKGNVK